MTIQGSSENLFEIQKKEINGNNLEIAFNSAIREMFFLSKFFSILTTLLPLMRGQFITGQIWLCG